MARNGGGGGAARAKDGAAAAGGAAPAAVAHTGAKAGTAAPAKGWSKKDQRDLESIHNAAGRLLGKMGGGHGGGAAEG